MLLNGRVFICEKAFSENFNKKVQKFGHSSRIDESFWKLVKLYEKSFHKFISAGGNMLKVSTMKIFLMKSCFQFTHQIDKMVQFRSAFLSKNLLILKRFYFRSMVFYPKLPRASAFVWFSQYPPSTNFIKLSDLKSTKIKRSFINSFCLKTFSPSNSFSNFSFLKKFACWLRFFTCVQIFVGIEWFFALTCCSYWMIEKLIKNHFDRILVQIYWSLLKLFPLNSPNHSELQTLVHFS